MRILFLDDDSGRHEMFIEHLMAGGMSDSVEATYVWSAEEAIAVLSVAPEPFDIAFLDHDLDGKIYVPSGPGTGFEVAEFIADMTEPCRPRKVICHSFNELGASKMANCLAQSNCWHRIIPFGERGYFEVLKTEAARNERLKRSIDLVR